MRISTLQSFNTGVNGINRNYENINRTQEQVSTGKRILTPSDDPIASVRLLQVDQEIEKLGRFQDNIVAANNSLNEEETLMRSTVNIINRIQELATQSGDASLSRNDRISLADEMEQRLDELVGLANSQNANGEYWFAGGISDQPPFVRDSAGDIIYQGDSQERSVQVDSSVLIPIRDNGEKVFQSIANASRVNTGKSDPNELAEISSARLVDSDQYNTFIDGRIGAGASADDFRIEVVQPAASGYPYAVQVYDSLGAAIGPEVDLQLKDSITGQPISLDVDGDGNIDVAALNAMGDDGLATLTADLSGVTGMEFEFYAPFDETTGTIDLADTESFDVQREENRSLMNTIVNLVNVLRAEGDDPLSNRVIVDSVGETLNNLSNSLDNINDIQGQIGSRLNILESLDFLQKDLILGNQEVKADLEEVDYAEALSRLNLESVILQASQQSFVRVQGLSLFNQL